MTKYILCLAGMILVLSGCGRDAAENALEKQIESETGANADVDLSANSAKISGETEDGAFSIVSGESARLPENLPSDVLIYKPSELKTTVDTPDGQSLSFTTPDSVEKVMDAYKREMTAKGWAEQASMNMGQQSMRVYNKENRIVHVTAGKVDAETQIMLVLAHE